MDPRPIGIFDSGVGGLTVARAVIDLLPHESVIYFGDTARFPYGPRSQAQVRRFAEEIMDLSLIHHLTLPTICSV
jgi:glutamate racemase